MEGFELFTGGRGYRGGPEPTVSITRGGTLTVNKAACALWENGPPDYVQLLFNRKSKTVALKPATQSDDSVYRLRPLGSGNGARSVGFKSFAEVFGIDLTENRKFTPRIEDDDCLTFSIR